jgi:hypothetical protein
MILGLDLSTVCVGWCILTEDEKYIDIGHLDIKKQKSLYEKLDKFSELIHELKEKYVNLIPFVEAPLFGSNNQNVVNLLQRANGMYCLELYRILKVKPILISNKDALEATGVQVPKGTKGLDRKKFILRHVQNLGIITEDKWDLKKTGNPKDFCYDQADAYVVALAGAKQT